jgi:ParB family chromosome partitioning protein
MKMDALRHQGTSRHDVEKLSSEILGQENGMTGRSVQRYIRLTELITELLDLVDNKKISLTIAYEISFLNKDVQSLILKYINKITINHVKALKGLDNVTEDTILEMITEPVKESGNISFSQKSLDKYFPKEYTKEQRQSIIIELLEQWKEKQLVEPSSIS